MSEKKVRVSMLWGPSLLARLRAFADAREITVSEAVRRLVEEGLTR